MKLPFDPENLSESMRRAMEIQANRQLAHANPDLAHSYTAILSEIHDQSDELERMVAKNLRENGYNVSDTNSAHGALGEIRQRAGEGDEDAGRLMWLVHMWNLMLILHDLVCIPRKAAKLAPEDTPGEMAAIPFDTRIDGNEPLDPLDFDPEMN